MKTTNITTLIANAVEVGFRFTDTNPIAVEVEVLQLMETNPAFVGATYNAEIGGEAVGFYIGLVPHQGWFAAVCESDGDGGWLPPVQYR